MSSNFNIMELSSSTYIQGFYVNFFFNQFITIKHIMRSSSRPNLMLRNLCWFALSKLYVTTPFNINFVRSQVEIQAWDYRLFGSL